MTPPMYQELAALLPFPMQPGPQARAAEEKR